METKETNNIYDDCSWNPYSLGSIYFDNSVNEPSHRPKSGKIEQKLKSVVINNKDHKTTRKVAKKLYKIEVLIP